MAKKEEKKEGPSWPTRPYWKGYLRLALVTIPVQIHTATESGKLALHQIHKPSGQRINYEVTAGGEPVDKGDLVKGYPIGEDTFVTFEPEELDAVKLESKKTLDLKEFIKKEEVAPPFFERPYYIVPEDEFSVEGYQVIHAALKKANRLGLGQIVMGGRENLVAVGALEKGLAMYVLRYPNELRKSENYFGDLPAKSDRQDMVDLALQLIDEHTWPFKPEVYKNSHEVALLALIKEKSKGKKIKTPEPETTSRPGGRNVVDLMEALKKSVKRGPGRSEEPAPAKKRSRGKKAS
jgi:DNA end-binding protein Ku